MVNYLKRFSSVLTELSEPLRILQKCGTVWAWGSEQPTAFEKIKTVLTTLPVLIYFDKDKDHIIQTDASKTGLGAVLLQEGQPVVYASRALTDTEHRYSNIDRELLGVVFGLKRLYHYTFGKSITVETDHQPLTSIWKKTTDTSTAILQRLLLRLAQYDVHIEYLRGKENVIADALSRVAPLKLEPQDCNTSFLFFSGKRHAQNLTKIVSPPNSKEIHRVFCFELDGADCICSSSIISSVSVSVEFQLLRANNYLGDNIIVVGVNITSRNLMYLFLFTFYMYS